MAPPNYIFMHIWNPLFFKNRPLFKPIIHNWESYISICTEWPAIEDYNNWLKIAYNSALSAGGSPIHFVAQADKSDVFAEQYEPRIYLRGEVQSRTQNWHDFFNALVWINFPKLKAALNAKQYKYIKQRWQISTIRVTIENALTLFDEGGIIIASSDDSLIELLQEFSWQELLYNQRQKFIENMQVIIFGHALYEKALNPYIGITGNAVIVKTDASFLQLPLMKQIEQLDSFLAKQFDDEAWIVSAHPFQPLPILGVPEWHEANNNVKFYENHDYFRGRGKRKTTPVINFDNRGL